LHNKPTESQTIVILNMYNSPFNAYGPNSEPLFDLKAAQEHLDDVYEDVFLEMAGFGEIEEIYFCRNLGDHLAGNCYIKYYEEDSATSALVGLRGRYYGGHSIVTELSPVTDFREARCRQYDVGECNRGGYCNFLHLAEPSRDLHKKLFAWQRKVHTRKRWEKKLAERKAMELEQAKLEVDIKRESSRSPGRERERSRNRGDRHERNGDRDRGDRKRERSRDRKEHGHRRRERSRDRSRDSSQDRYSDNSSKRRKRSTERKERSSSRGRGEWIEKEPAAMAVETQVKLESFEDYGQ